MISVLICVLSQYVQLSTWMQHKMTRPCISCFGENDFWKKYTSRSGITGGGLCLPPRLLTGKFLLTYREKKRQGKKGKGEGEMDKKWSKIVLTILKAKHLPFKKGRYFAFHFSKQLKFVLGLPKWKFSTGEKAFHTGEKSWKMTLPPQKTFPVTPLTSGPRYWNVPVLVNTGTFLVYQYCLKMWYLRYLECAGGIEKQTKLECRNGPVLSNTHVPISGTWSTLFSDFFFFFHFSATIKSGCVLIKFWMSFCKDVPLTESCKL